MPSGITVQIKIKPYLKDYLIHKYGEGNHPVPATTRNKLFPFLFSYLTKASKDYKPLNSSDPNIISFELPYNEYLVNIRYNCHIHPDSFGEIHSFLYGIFYNDFTRDISKTCQQDRLPIKNAVIDFCLENNISFDRANYDSLRRIYLRWRNNNSKSKKTKKSQPVSGGHFDINST